MAMFPHVHSAMAYELMSRQESAFSRLGISVGSMAGYPLIGKVSDPRLVVCKVDFIDALRWDAGVIRDTVPEAMSLDPQDVTGHSLRRSGCKGVPLELIQFMSRHSSQAVLDYVEDAMEECPRLQFKLQEHFELRGQIAYLVNRSNNVERGLEELKRHVETVANQWNVPLDQEAVLKLFDRWARPRVIANMISKKLRSSATNTVRVDNRLWLEMDHCG